MRTLFTLIVFSTLFSNTLLVPEEYFIIQEGIDAAVEGDTVLVNQGTYEENLLIDKSILLTSYAIFDNLTNWVEYDNLLYSKWMVENLNIDSTIIDGSSATLVNSIVYYNRREGDAGINYNLNGYSGDILDEYDVLYSDIEGDENWIPNGTGNIFTDPLFTDPDNGDFTLQESSPCIDTGTADLDGDGYEDMTDYYGLAPDMGALEYYNSDYCDLNFDGEINILDVIFVLNCALDNEGCHYLCMDYNEDENIDILDIIMMINIILEN